MKASTLVFSIQNDRALFHSGIAGIRVSARDEVVLGDARGTRSVGLTCRLRGILSKDRIFDVEVCALIKHNLGGEEVFDAGTVRVHSSRPALTLPTAPAKAGVVLRIVTEGTDGPNSGLVLVQNGCRAIEVGWGVSPSNHIWVDGLYQMDPGGMLIVQVGGTGDRFVVICDDRARVTVTPVQEKPAETSLPPVKTVKEEAPAAPSSPVAVEVTDAEVERLLRAVAAAKEEALEAVAAAPAPVEVAATPVSEARFVIPVTDESTTSSVTPEKVEEVAIRVKPAPDLSPEAIAARLAAEREEEELRRLAASTGGQRVGTRSKRVTRPSAKGKSRKQLVSAH